MGRSCTTCKKTEPEVKLKNCTGCSSTPYCGRDCQKAEWKSHMRTCGAPLSPPKGLKRPVTKPYTRLEKGTWLHNRPETDVYTLLIDAYRLRAEDDFLAEGKIEDGSIYTGFDEDAENAFQEFVGKAAEKPGLLPPWWNDEKRFACGQFGLTGLGWDTWADLEFTLGKNAVVEHYGDARFPMQLRMFAEAVYGSGPGGEKGGARLRKALAEYEAHGADAPEPPNWHYHNTYNRDFSRRLR